MLRRSPPPLLLAALCVALAGCATPAPAPAPAPHAAPPPQSDSAPAKPPPVLAQVPEVVPVPEPIRAGGPNKPYEQFGVTYTPLPPDAAWSERGLASWYGRKFHGRRTASGEVYDMHAMTAAHRTLPLPSYARVSNPANGRSVVVRVNDRGPFIKGRVIDLSYAAALKLGALGGVTPVRVERITPAQIRSGAWRPGAPVVDGDEPPERVATPAAPAPAPPVQAGPSATRDEAQRAADRVVDKLRPVPVVVERR